MIVIACLISFIVGVILGVAAEWRLLKPWVDTALRQAAVLHGPLKRTNFAAGPDDADARARVGRP